LTKHHDKSVIFNISVERLADDTIKIAWRTDRNIETVSIFKGDAPNRIDRSSPVSQVSQGTFVEISVLEKDKQLFFELIPDHYPGIITAERYIPLEGTFNFRDLGGYETTSGLRVKWGLLFRSDNLARLSDADLIRLQEMGLKTAIDLRASAEMASSPDRLPEDGSIQHIHLPIKDDEFDATTRFEQIKKGDIDWLTLEFMVNGYINNVDMYAPHWGRAIDSLARSGNRPLVFHCTAGKDRAGTLAALVLLTLGVPEQTVIYDHGLSNTYIGNVIKKVYDYLKSYDIDTSRLDPYFFAPRECIVALLDHFRTEYGSAENYLRKKAGVKKDTLALLKNELLE
jgi:protein-tyrosine phosphatase